MRTAKACRSVCLFGNFLFGSFLFKCFVDNTSGAIKSAVPITSGANFPGTTNPSMSIMLAPEPFVGSINTFLYDRSECAKPALCNRLTPLAIFTQT